MWWLWRACVCGCVQVEKEKEALRMELNKAKQQIKEADTAIGSQKAEIEKLNHIINEADQERIRQKKEYDVVVNERDILGTQVGVVVGGRRNGSALTVLHTGRPFQEVASHPQSTCSSTLRREPFLNFE